MSLHSIFIHDWLIEDFFIKIGLYSCSTVAIFFIKTFIFWLLIIVFDYLVLVLVKAIVSWSLLKLWLLCTWIDLISIFDNNFFVFIFETFYHSILLGILHEFSVVKALSFFDLFCLILWLIVLFLPLHQSIWIPFHVHIRFDKLRLW